jgi:hypothetical protein
LVNREVFIPNQGPAKDSSLFLPGAQVAILQNLQNLGRPDTLQTDVIPTLALLIGIDIEAGPARLCPVEDTVTRSRRRAVHSRTFWSEQG